MKNVAFIGIETPIVLGILQVAMLGRISEKLERELKQDGPDKKCKSFGLYGIETSENNEEMKEQTNCLMD